MIHKHRSTDDFSSCKCHSSFSLEMYLPRHLRWDRAQITFTMNRVTRAIRFLRKQTSWTRLFCIILPIYGIHSLDDAMDRSLLFSDCSKFSHYLLLFQFYYMMISLVIANTHIEELRSLTPLHNLTLGAMARIMYFCFMLYALELMLTRLWFFYKRKTNQIDFIKLIKKLSDEDCIELTHLLRLNCAAFASMAFVALSLDQIIQLRGEETFQGKALSIFWIFFIFFELRNAGCYMIVVYYIAAADLTVIGRKIDHLESSIKLLHSSAIANSDQVTHVIHTMQGLFISLRQFNPFVVMLMTTNKLFLVPSVSLVIYFTHLENQGHLMVILYYLVISTSALYLFRGYLITYFMSSVHKRSLSVHNLLASLLARSQLPWHHKIKLIETLHNISGTNNQLSLSESSGIISRTTVIGLIFRTLSFVFLLFDFGGRFRAAPTVDPSLNVGVTAVNWSADCINILQEKCFTIRDSNRKLF